MPTGNENQNQSPLYKKVTSVVLAVTAIAGLAIAEKTNKIDVGTLFRADLSQVQHTAVDGFTYPIQEIPNWEVTGYNGNAKHWDDFKSSEIIPIPKYDPNNLEDINTALTYSTLYLGKYSYSEGETPKEESGSHNGIDIVGPKGLPVHSIANGVVTFAGTKSGYGKTVVIRHDNVPSYDNPNQKTTYFSGYAHLDSIESGLKSGTIVQMSEKIGEVGDDGNSTTDHLNFSLDKEDAPFYPYWPFTGAEANEQGLSFFEAVNAGLGLENGRRYTVNPLGYINKYKDYFEDPSDTSENDPEPNDDPVDETVEETPEEPEGNSEEDSEQENENNVEPDEPSDNLNPAAPEEPGIDTGLFTFEFSSLETATPANGAGSRLTITDVLGAMGDLDDSATLEIEVNGVGKVKPNRLNPSDFENGKATVYMSSEEPGKSVIQVGKSTYTMNYFDLDEAGTTSRLHLSFEDGKLYKDQEHIMIVETHDINEQKTPRSFPGKISFSITDGSAEFKPNELTYSDFESGQAEVTVVSSADDLSVIARNGSIVSEEEDFRFRDFEAFKDVPLTHEYAEDIYALRDRGIIRGNGDGTYYNPNDEVTRAAAAKVLMMAANVKVEEKSTQKLSFKDIEEDAWYIPTLQAAVREGVIKGDDTGNTVRPGDSVNYAEFSTMLMRSFGIDLPNTVSVKPYDDVPTNHWATPSVYQVNRMNLRDVPSNRFELDKPVTRAELARMANRLLVVSENHLVSYVGDGV